MKKLHIRKMIALLLCMMVLISSASIGVIAEGSESISVGALDTVLYTAKQAFGKRFIGGENESVTDEKQLDILAENLEIASLGTSYRISFDIGPKKININAELVEARTNNVNDDHYVISPNDFFDADFSVVNAKFTTSANKYDLMPVNTTMVGKNVLSIILEHKSTGDIYYIQAEMQLNYNVINCIELDGNGVAMLSTSSSDDARLNANEYYSIKNQKSEIHQISSADIENITADEETYEIYEALKGSVSDVSIAVAEKLGVATFSYSNNPYYHLGIPNSTFTSRNNLDKWRWLPPTKIPNGEVNAGKKLPIYYYANSYEEYGTDYIYTLIMILGFTDVLPTLNSDPYEYTSAGVKYYEQRSAIKMEVYQQPHTVIYDPSTDTYDFLLGGENQSRIVTPALEMVKNSTDAPQVLTGRYSFSTAEPATGLLPWAVLRLGDIGVRLLDTATYGLGSEVIDILDYMTDANYNVDESNPTNINANDKKYETYNPSAAYQYGKWKAVFGGVKCELNGYLCTVGQNYGLQTWFSVPKEYGKSCVNNVAWTSFTGIELY